MKQFIRYSCLGLALLIASGQGVKGQWQKDYYKKGGEEHLSGSPVAAQTKKDLAFGALEAMSADTARTKAAAWLKEAGKTDQATTQKFDAIWKDGERSVLDRLADTFALGNADAAKILTEARHPLSPAPVKVPEILKNDAQPVFFRANLALAYARLLANRRIHEEALDMLKLYAPEQVVEPSTYLFHRGVCEHGLLQKADADRTITTLLRDVMDAPERYKTVALLMLLDMHAWKEKDLATIARKMDNVERRLELDRAGPQTQKQQREIVARLDEMIKELENKAKKKPGPPSDGPPQDGCPDGSQPGPPGGEPKPGMNPKSPAPDPYVTGQGGPGFVDPAKLKKLAGEWGSMPPAERQRILAALTAGMSQRHKEAIENYFRNIAQASSRK